MKITHKMIGSKRVYDVRGYLGKYTDINGNTKTKTYHHGGFSSSKAAKLAFDRAKVEFDHRKNNPAAIMDNPTFDEVYEVWLKTYKLGVKESTLNRVEGIFKHHITPSFGGMRINTITWQKCQEEALKWRESVKQFNKLAQYAALVFRIAQKMGVITTNPMKLVDVPKIAVDYSKDKAADNFWTAEQLATFLAVVDATDGHRTQPRYDRSALFYLLATTGMRKGEALALTWSDIDLKNGLVTINKTISRSIDNHQIISTPKTRNAYRTLSLNSSTIDRLKKYRKSLVVIPRAKDLIFTNQKGQIMSVMTPNHWLEALIGETDLPTITVHGLRHTFASIQVANNINVKALQMQMGHSDIKITLNIYAHLSQQELSAQVYDMSKILAQ